MYTSSPREAALGASRLLNTPISEAAGAGQVISIIRGEGSHTYVNTGVGGLRIGGMGGGFGGVCAWGGQLGCHICVRGRGA